MFRDPTKARYIVLRNIVRRFQDEITRNIPNAAFDEGGRNLGLLRGETLVFRNENESAVLMDHCAYTVRVDGRTFVERAAATSTATRGSDERMALDAMVNARYGILRVEAEPIGVTIPMHDLLRNEPVEFVDVWLSKSLRDQDGVGYLLATRYLTIDEEGFSLSTGTSLPVQFEMLEPMVYKLFDEVPEVTRLPLRLTRDGWRQAEIAVISTLLQLRAADYIQVRELSPGPTGRRFQSAAPPSSEIPRNAPCPCGSGHKYKKCCGRISVSTGRAKLAAHFRPW